MSKPGFYNDNRFRAYPFLLRSVGVHNASAGTVEKLDNDTVVDAGFLMGLYSGYKAGVHSVWLDSVARSGSIVTFTFRSDAPGLYRRPLTFTRDLATVKPFAIEYSDDTDPAFGVSEYSDSAVFEVSHDSPEDCPPEPLWSGFLVTGVLTNLAADLASGHTFTRSTGGVLEPALVQSTVASYVSSINIANQDRSRVSAAAGCNNPVWPFPTGEDKVYISARCLRGDVRFKPGFNASIQQEDFNNAVAFGGQVGAGLGTVCDDPPKLFPGEVPPAGSTLLEGGTRCNEVIRSINGIGGQFASLLSGTGVNITVAPTSHKVIVDVNMSGLSVCYSDHPFSEVSEIV